MVLRGAILYCLTFAILTIIHFPYASDELPQSTQVTAFEHSTKAETFYQDTYDSDADDFYVQAARQAAELANVEGKIRSFVEEYGLKDRRILDVGAGSGMLQDVVHDYTALDISPSAKRFFHKPFVLGSATAMPFRDDEFDAAWTIWVLEHVPQPELALREIRRVVRHRGFIYLAPQWNCTPWAADGYEVRPYSDFGLTGKITKASIPFRRHPLYRFSYLVPIRSVRLSRWFLTRSPTSLRYHRLTPNYDKYWVTDSDAVNSIDFFEAYLWFTSRGDTCLNCRNAWDELLLYNRWALIIQVEKPSRGN
ncbi:MAG: class I SAM-dependent methyltransferase [Acidobacteria bacterium]|nr:class I SAM-dependent methyltransferase [Acidobacteriota bacterium]